MPTNVLTDNKRARLQMQLQADYEQLAKEGHAPHQIYATLVNRVHYNLSDPQSGLYDLSYQDQCSVYTLLNTFFEACPHYLRLKQSDPQLIFVVKYKPIPQNSFHQYRSHCYCPANDAIFTWLMLDTLMFRGLGAPRYSHSNNENAWVWLLIILGALAVAAAFVAMYYLFSQFCEDMERFWHNEGWMQAAVSMLATAASGCAAGLLTAIFLSAPLISLALAAGVSNPIGVVILAIVCLSVVGAALGGFITNTLQDFALKKAHPEAMDVNDVHRFVLTESERANLAEKGFEPEKVLTAMVAIRQAIGNEKLPSLLNRIFTEKGGEKQELLSKIRQLRRGDIDPSGVMRVDMPRNDTTKTEPYTLQFQLRPFPVVYVQQQIVVYPQPQQAMGPQNYPQQMPYGYPQQAMPSYQQQQQFYQPQQQGGWGYQSQPYTATDMYPPQNGYGYQ